MKYDAANAFPKPAVGLSGRTGKRNMTALSVFYEDAPVPVPVAAPRVNDMAVLPQRKEPRFRRTPFYLKIDGLDGPRPAHTLPPESASDSDPDSEKS